MPLEYKSIITKCDISKMDSFYFFRNNRDVDDALKGNNPPKLNEVSEEGVVRVWKVDSLKFTTNGLHPNECEVYYLKDGKYKLCGKIPIGDWRLNAFTIPFVVNLIRCGRNDLEKVQSANFPSESGY